MLFRATNHAGLGFYFRAGRIYGGLSRQKAAFYPEARHD